MAFEFDLETLNDNLDPFGLTCPEMNHFVEKLEELCRTYRKSTDDVSDELVSVMNNVGKKRVDLNVLMALEESLETQSKKAAHTPRAVRKPVRMPLAERSGFALSSVGGDDEKDNHANMSTATFAKLEGHFLEFSPFPNTPANEKFLKRADGGQVINTIRGKNYQESGLKGTSKHVEKVKVVSKQPSILYGGDKSSLVIEAKAKRMSEFAARFQDTYEEIVDWGNPHIPSVDVVFTYGQVVHDDMKDEKFGENSIALMINDEDGTMVRLDVSKINEEVTLFPGQIIAVRGTNETGEELQVDRIYHSHSLPIQKIETDTSKDIWFACGPYTANDNCGYEHLCELLDKVVLEKPDVLILAGPFIDRRNTFLQKPAFTCTNDDLLEDMFMKIKQKLFNTRTEVIIQPSACRDLCTPPVFPSAPFQLNWKRMDSVKKEIHFVPDPCVLRVGGIEIAITSSEPIQGLSNHEFHRSVNQENCDRVARLNSHLLTQQSIYPLEPTELPCSMAGVLEVCRLTSTPHIFFAPSRLAPSAKIVDQCVFVNSSTLAKGQTGNYVKMSINLLAGELANGESVADYSNIQILKI